MGTLSQGTEFTPEGPPWWDCLRESYSAGGDREGQKAQSLSVQPDAALDGHHFLFHPVLSGSGYTPQQMGNQGLEKDRPLFKVTTGEGWEQR